MTMRDFKKLILDMVFPNRCPFCEKVIGWKMLCCHECEDKIQYIEEYCPVCGKENCICHDTEINYDGCDSAAYYSGIVKSGVLNLKTVKSENLAELLCENLLSKLKARGAAEAVDLVTYVPMNAKKERERGFNQAKIIASEMSRRIKKPCKGNILLKLSKDTVQHELNFKERQLAAGRSYGLSSGGPDIVKGKVVLLCDDVITTGSTLNACAAQLKKAGAAKVCCAALANTKRTGALPDV